MQSNTIDFSNIVGSKQVSNGGILGDLIELSINILNNAKNNGQLREADVGTILAQIIPNAMQVAVNFELQRAKVEADIEATKKQTELEEKKTNTNIEISRQELVLKEKDTNSVINSRQVQDRLNSFKLQVEKETLAIEKEKLELFKEQNKADTELKRQEIQLRKEQISASKMDTEIKKQQLKISELEAKLKKDTIELEKQRLANDAERLAQSIQEIKNKIDTMQRRTTAEVELLHSQTKAFRDNSKQQLLKTAIDGYAMLFENSDDLQSANALPRLFKSNGIDKVAKNMFENYGIDTTGVF